MTDFLKMNNVEYKLHPVYDIYGVSECGKVMNIQTKSFVNPFGGNIRVKPLKGKSKRYPLNLFIWEAFKGSKTKGMTIIHVNGDVTNYNIDNLEEKVNRRNKKHSSDEERRASDDESKARWREKEWQCPYCAQLMKNNMRCHHKRICKFTINPYTKEDKQRKEETDAIWRNKPFKCSKCDYTGKNGNKYLHNKKHHSD